MGFPPLSPVVASKVEYVGASGGEGGAANCIGGEEEVGGSGREEDGTGVGTRGKKRRGGDPKIYNEDKIKSVWIKVKY